MKTDLDLLDLEILRLLQGNSALTIKEVAQSVHLSISPTFDRIKQLQEKGYIRGQVALLNRKKLQLGLMVHCQITLEKQNKKNFSAFEQAIKEFPQVTSCHLVSGSFDYLVNVVCADVESYNKFFQEKLAVLPFVAHINTLFVMDEIKNTTELPI